MLDETVDTMALLMASFTLDQIEQQLRDSQQTTHAHTLQKLQVDIGFQHQALSEGLNNVNELEACTPEVQQQINAFEPVTHERLKVLTVIHNALPEGDLKDELKALNDELAKSAPALPTSVQTVKPEGFTP